MSRKRLLGLRTSRPDGTSYHDPSFVWGGVGEWTEVKTWSPNPVCGGGLHALLWGQGDLSLLSDASDALWQVVEIPKKHVDLGDKIKARRMRVVWAGDREGACAYLARYAPAGITIPWTTATAGDYGTATAGDSGTATAGYRGTATAGNSGTATAGNYGTATAGDCGTIVIKWWDGKRYRLSVGYCGENGIEPGVKYRVVNGQFEMAP